MSLNKILTPFVCYVLCTYNSYVKLCQRKKVYFSMEILLLGVQ